MIKSHNESTGLLCTYCTVLQYCTPHHHCIALYHHCIVHHHSYQRRTLHASLRTRKDDNNTLKS